MLALESLDTLLQGLTYRLHPNYIKLTSRRKPNFQPPVSTLKHINFFRRVRLELYLPFDFVLYKFRFCPQVYPDSRLNYKPCH